MGHSVKAKELIIVSWILIRRVFSSFIFEYKTAFSINSQKTLFESRLLIGKGCIVKALAIYILVVATTAVGFTQCFGCLFVCVVAGADHCTDGGIGKAQFVCFFFKNFELVRRYIA